MFAWVDICSSQPLCRGIQSAFRRVTRQRPRRRRRRRVYFGPFRNNPENNGVDQIVTRPLLLVCVRFDCAGCGDWRAVPGVCGVRRTSGKEPVCAEVARGSPAPDSFHRLQRAERPLQDVRTRQANGATNQLLSAPLRGSVRKQSCFTSHKFSYSFHQDFEFA